MSTDTLPPITGTPAGQALAAVSARIGADPLLIQAAGGNSSIKDRDTLWVKASGLWLRDALTRPMFVPLALDEVRARVAAGDADPVGPALRREAAPQGLRPSIETTLHALMPHPVVLHVHAVDAIAWAVLPGAEQALRGLLAGERWAWVDYARPGLPLTRAVAAITALRAVDLLVMANHGLVVGGATAAEAEGRLAAVVARLRRPCRPAPPADLERLSRIAASTGWRLPERADLHALAIDPVLLRRARRGVLYPDHVVFLGASLACAPAGLDEQALSLWLVETAGGEAPPPCVAWPGHGILLRPDLGEAAREMLGCLADVLRRLPDAPEPIFLPDDEVRALADWEAERFRRQQQR